LNIDFIQGRYKFSSFKLSFYRKIISYIVEKEGFKLISLNIAFVGKKKMLEYNKTILNHCYTTDVITLDYSEANHIFADVIICIPQVQLNAERYSVSFEQELARVIIHAVLHVTGYDDGKPSDRKRMRRREDYYLKKFGMLKSL